MRQFSLAAAPAVSALRAEPLGRSLFLFDVAMTAVMLGMTSAFVGALALSLS